jgi:hypothetical protein
VRTGLKIGEPSRSDQFRPLSLISDPNWGYFYCQDSHSLILYVVAVYIGYANGGRRPGILTIHSFLDFSILMAL